MTCPKSPKKKPPHPRGRRAAPAINPRYNGYLKPHAARIAQLASEGKSPTAIGRILYAEGVRSPHDKGSDYSLDSIRSIAGLVYFVLRLRPENAKEKLRRRIARAQDELRELEQQQRRQKVIDGLKSSAHLIAAADIGHPPS